MSAFSHLSFSSLTASEHPWPLQTLPRSSQRSSGSCLFSDFKKNGCGRRGKPYSIFRKTVNISLFLTKHTLLTLQCKYFIAATGNFGIYWYVWRIVVQLKTLPWTPSSYLSYTVFKKHLTLRIKGVIESTFFKKALRTKFKV